MNCLTPTYSSTQVAESRCTWGVLKEMKRSASPLMGTSTILIPARLGGSVTSNLGGGKVRVRLRVRVRASGQG